MELIDAAAVVSRCSRAWTCARGTTSTTRCRQPGGHRSEGPGFVEIALVYGQIEAAPASGGCQRPGHHGVLHNGEGQDVLLFIDNIFRFSQAGPKCPRSSAAPQARWVPTDPGRRDGQPARANHLQGGQSPPSRPSTFPPTTRRRRQHSGAWTPPSCWSGRDRRTGHLSSRPSARRRRARWRGDCRRGALRRRAARPGGAALKDLPDIIAILAWTSCRPEDERTVSGAPSSVQPPVSSAGLHRPRRPAGVGRRHRARLRGILDGKHKHVPEGNFYMKGGIEEIAT